MHGGGGGHGSPTMQARPPQPTGQSIESGGHPPSAVSTQQTLPIVFVLGPQSMLGPMMVSGKGQLVPESSSIVRQKPPAAMQAWGSLDVLDVLVVLAEWAAVVLVTALALEDAERVLAVADAPLPEGMAADVWLPEGAAVWPPHATTTSANTRSA
jgi:hypothetical protein